MLTGGAAQDDGEEASDAGKPNGDGGQPGDPEAAADEPPSGRAEDAAWEQMDDNFLLGDDQEEEVTEKRTVGVTE